MQRTPAPDATPESAPAGQPIEASAAEAAPVAATLAPAARPPLPARLAAAVEGWYAGHHHRAITTGSACISVDEKAALLQAVLDAA